MQSLVWQGKCLKVLNQTLLPGRVEYICCTDYRRVGEAIKKLEVRGAPAIGAAAAYALVLGAQELSPNSGDFLQDFSCIAEELRQTRPTAVNLFWAINRMVKKAQACAGEDISTIVTILGNEAQAIAREDELVNQKISKHGAQLFTGKSINILTHCNAGALATVAQGTALGVIREAYKQGTVLGVFADETRPLLQGARLTAWELMQDNIPVTLITDNMAGWVMKNKMVQAVIVGADRIALNGDVANKIGTYSVAVLAKEHGIPFYVAAPKSTFDFSIASGDDIPIEERSREEVVCFGGRKTAPEGVAVFNPAFDVTPNEYITAIITEYGILRAPYQDAINKLQLRKG